MRIANVRWIERQPEPGDTVKIDFAKWTGIGTQIGIYLRRFDGNDIIEFGRMKRYLPTGSTFFCLSI
jgi:hypothetical protein